MAARVQYRFILKIFKKLHNHIVGEEVEVFVKKMNFQRH